MNLFRVYTVAGIILILDQLTKFLVLRVLHLNDRLLVKFIDPYLNFQMAWNRGINFGLFGSESNSARLFLIAISVVICVMLTWWYRHSIRLLTQICVGLIIGGALGNALDRIAYGAVADFLNISCCGLVNPFSFNIADVAIFFGAIGLIFFGDEQKKEIL